ncbi:hypothetical protein [Oligoflexus tunisiensis]|uniref:hypothetical protein n=1 Tax=Oligoflexus tunisiensis TaxID=708132 RepID=UPI00114CACA8|nr:hypothetical protein [Oligoflexus tunisiensis]
MIDTFLHSFSTSPMQVKSVKVLRIVIGLVFVIRIATELPFASYFWGPNGIGQGSAVVYFGSALGPILDKVFQADASVVVLLIANLALAILLIAGKSHRLCCALLFISSTMFQTRLAEIQDGGDNLTSLLLIYLIFTTNSGSSRYLWLRGVKIWVHNLAVMTIGFQIAILYMTSGFLKAQGLDWYSGIALYNVSQVDWVSLPSIRPIFNSPLVSTLACYVTIFFQCTFPVAIFSRLKLVWLAIGIIFHIGIAIYMGLVPFALIMVGAELFFIIDSEWNFLARRFKLMARSLPFRLKEAT